MLTAVWLSNRLAFFVYAGCLLCLPPCNVPKRLVPDIVLLGIVCLFSIHTAWMYLRVEHESLSAFDCMKRAAPGKRLRLMLVDTRSRVMDHTPYDHIDQYYAIRQSGIVYNPFAVLTHMPVKYRPEFMAKEAAFRPEVYRTKTGFIADIRFSDYDYFLIRSQRDPELVKLFGKNAEWIARVFQKCPWFLYKKYDASLKYQVTDPGYQR